MTSTPDQLGYRMPAEWEPHEATWLAWPHSGENCFGLSSEKIHDTYACMIEALSSGEQIRILFRNQKERDLCFSELKRRKVTIAAIQEFYRDYQDIWIRDYGPTFITGIAKKEKAWCKWKFNAWGKKYQGGLADDQVFDPKAGLIASRSFAADFVLEGGAFDVNGKGICLTTESCLLNGNRNPKWTKQDYEKNFKAYLGADQVIWFPSGLEGDDTDGHVDQVARFISEDAVLVSKNRMLLSKELQNRNLRVTIIDLPLPDPMTHRNVLLPASYANFYIANGIVLVPVYQCRQDRDTLRLFNDCFPHRTVIPVPARYLVQGLGSIHCVTQQEPQVN